MMEKRKSIIAIAKAFIMKMKHESVVTVRHIMKMKHESVVTLRHIHGSGFILQMQS